MSKTVQTGVIKTRIPSRLDRLPWSKFHWRVVIGLGSVWVLDGLEVTMIGNVSARLTESDSGIDLSAGQIGLAAAIYIAGACCGALFFGQLTDRFGRKKLFIITLLVYLTATVATAFAFAPWYFFLARFVTGAGIGGEYAAVNSAIDELIPARVRGRVDIIINGSYWLGAAVGAGGALVALNFFAPDLGWRLTFGIGAILGLMVLVVRRNVPESPRWLFIHGQEDEAERIVDGIEHEVIEETGEELPEAEDTLTVRQRKTIPIREIAKVAFKLYPKRTILGLSLFVGQAFMYNGVTFNLGTLLHGFYGISSGLVPVFFIVWALSNFAGPLVLGRLFDTVGRKPMISISYLGSALIAVVLAFVFLQETGGIWLFMVVLMMCFFLASSGASAAYLTVSEIFPMETRALAIAFFYALGTAIGGISGPLLFGQLIGSGVRGNVAISFLIGAAVMALGGVVELIFGVKAEGQKLEDLAMPLTTADVDEDGGTPSDDSADQKAGDNEDSPDEPESPASDEQRAAADAEKQDKQHSAARRDARTERRRDEATRGARRYRPGPRSSGYSPWLPPVAPEAGYIALDREIETIALVVAERGAMDTRALYNRVGGRYWGPGRFRDAVREALAEDKIQRVGRGRFGPPLPSGGGPSQNGNHSTSGDTRTQT